MTDSNESVGGPSGEDSPWNRFDEHSQRAIVFAQEEARSLLHGYIGPEHILLGVLGEDIEVTRSFARAGLPLSKIRKAVVAVVGPGRARRDGSLTILPAGKKTLAMAVSEADQAESDALTPEHLLHGSLANRQSAVPQLLRELRVTEEAIWDIYRETNPDQPVAERTEATTSQSEPGAPSCSSCEGSLRDLLGWTVVETQQSEDQPAARVRVAYCTRCGTAVTGKFDDRDAGAPVYT